MANTMIGNKPTSAEAIDKMFEKTLCKGQGDNIMRLSKQYGIDPALVCGIIKVETGGSPDNGNPNGRHKNNPMSVLGGNHGGNHTYPTMEEGIEAGIKNLANSRYYSGDIDFNKFSSTYLGPGGGNLTQWRRVVGNTYQNLTGGNINEVQFNKGGVVQGSTTSQSSTSSGNSPKPSDPLTKQERLKKLEEVFKTGDSNFESGKADLKKVMGYYGDHLPDEYVMLLDKYPKYKEYYDKNKAEAQLQNQILMYRGNPKSSKSKAYLEELNKQKSTFESAIRADDDKSLKYIKEYIKKNKVIPATFFNAVNKTTKVKEFLVEEEQRSVREMEEVLKSGDEARIKKYLDKKRELWLNYGYEDTPFQYRQLLAKYGRTANKDGRFINKLMSKEFPRRHKKKLPNPYVAYLQISVGKYDLAPIPPKYMMNFNYERISDSNQGTGNKFSFSLFDKSAIEMEYYLAQGLDDVEFEYGVYDGNKSKRYKGKITHYDIDFSSAGATLNVEGISSGLATFGEPKTVTYKSGNPAEIVRQIAKEENWNIGKIEDTEIVYEDDKKKTPKQIVRTNKDAISFITSDLVPIAKSLNHKDSNFICYFEDVADKSNDEYVSKVFFVSQGWKDEQKKEDEDSEGVIIYEFEIGVDGESDVISFNPQYSGLLTAILGANEVDVITVNSIANEMFNVRIKDSSKEKSDETIGDNKDRSQRRIIPIPQSSEDEARKIAASMWYKQANQSYQATLSILGDPTIEPFKFASILNIPVNDSGLPHHSTGIYVITRVTDTISDTGVFTTELSLIRNGLNVSLDENGRIKVTASPPPSIEGSSDGNKEPNPFQQGGGNGSIVAEAEKHIGKSKFVSSFTNGLWCADFTTYVLKQSGNYNLKGSSSSCVGMAYLYKKENKLTKDIKGYTPKPGDTIFFKSSRTENWTNHVGVVKSVNPGPPFSMTTIEGNSGANFTTTGGKVCENHYKSRTGNSYINIVAYGMNG